MITTKLLPPLLLVPPARDDEEEGAGRTGLWAARMAATAGETGTPLGPTGGRETVGPAVEKEEEEEEEDGENGVADGTDGDADVSAA